MTITSASSYSYAGHNFQFPRIMILRICEYSRRSNAFASCDKTRENVESSNVDRAARQEQVERARSIKERFRVGTFDFCRKNIATFHAPMMPGLRFPRSTAHQMEFISASEQRGRVIVIYTYAFPPRFSRLAVERSSPRVRSNGWICKRHKVILLLPKPAAFFDSSSNWSCFSRVLKTFAFYTASKIGHERLEKFRQSSWDRICARFLCH